MINSTYIDKYFIRRAERWRVYELLKSVLSSRQRLVESVVNGEKPKVCPSPPKRPRTVLAQNVKNRYFQELALIREEVGESSQSSEDENYPGKLFLFEEVIYI